MSTAKKADGIGTRAGIAVECRNLWKIFGDRQKEALDALQTKSLSKSQALRQMGCMVGVADVSFTVPAGEIFCIMGLSGSGKSTLVRQINRLIEPTAGSISVQGEDILKLGPRELRRIRAERIAMVFQHTGLLPHRTVAENVAFPLEIRKVDKSRRREESMRALASVQLSGWEDCYPDELSGGMQQRVGLARALAADPQILLMDEPFSSLDPLIRRQLQDQFLALSATMKKTTIFITHDLDEAIRLGDRIAIMKDGRFVQVGTAEEIVTDPADDYVADFVRGISRLKLVHAAKIMEPLERSPRRELGSLDGGPTAPLDADLDTLIEVSNRHGNRSILILDGERRPVGVVTTADLLQGIKGRPSPSTSSTSEPAQPQSFSASADRLVRMDAED